MKIRFDKSKTDKDGKCFFWILWMDTYNPSDPTCTPEHPMQRAQAYYADPHEFGYPRPEETNATEITKEDATNGKAWKDKAEHRRLYDRRRLH